MSLFIDNSLLKEDENRGFVFTLGLLDIMDDYYSIHGYHLTPQLNVISMKNSNIPKVLITRRGFTRVRSCAAYDFLSYVDSNSLYIGIANIEEACPKIEARKLDKDVLFKANLYLNGGFSYELS